MGLARRPGVGMEGGRNLRSVTVEDAAEHLGVGEGTLGVPTQPIVFAMSSARISTKQ